MGKSSSKLLVIDASILQATLHGQHPTSKICRDLLKDILRICHRAVVTPPIRVEWDNHDTPFTIQWRSAMASRDKVVDLEAYPLRDVRNAIRQLIPEDQKHISEKDVHLLEAAVQGDKCVISLDDRARRQFSIVAPAEKVTEDIMWVNPTENPNATMKWLEKGADLAPEWVLGQPDVPAAATKMTRKKRTRPRTEDN